MGATTTGPQRANLTHWNGNAAEFSGSSALPLVAGVRGIFHGTVSFGTGETGDKTSGIGALSAASADEVLVWLTSCPMDMAPDASVWGIGIRVSSASQVIVSRNQLFQGGGGTTAGPNTYYFTAVRMVK
jgi:hypothetical protein